ncbi:MAG TPA: hypothetical protein VHU44_11785 [Acidobacteriaceae bacterium]|nr:hypothetical protein [Acidobacteriaceae bacterium]
MSSARYDGVMPKVQPDSISPRRIALLFALFFAICLGLGYPILNRIDWRRAPGGLTDLQQYAKLVTAPPVPDLDQHTQFRVLIPYVARPFYHLALNRFGSWDPVMFGLLVSNSLFVAGTVTLLLLIALHCTGSYPVALGSALLYLLNFIVPNARLIGFIDSGEAFFLMLVLWSLTRQHYYLLPFCALLGTTAKETFVIFLLVFTAVWWLVSRKKQPQPRTAPIWIAASWCLAFATLALLQWSITGAFRSPLRFGLDLHHHASLARQFPMWLRDRNLWYTFLWLLPLGLPRLNRFPPAWRYATGATCICAFALDAWYGAAPGTMARAQFTLAAPLLIASAAWLLFEPQRTAPAVAN